MGRLYLVIVVVGTALAIGSGARLKVEIGNVERSAGRASFHVVVRNLGSTPLYLEEFTKGKGDLYAVNIERATGPHTWEVVGPHRDTQPPDVFPLQAGGSTEVRIDLPDPYPKIYETPARYIPLVGRFRATVRYFHSQAEWEKIRKERTRRWLEARSSSVTIPQRK
jgi:hypothetical protein